MGINSKADLANCICLSLQQENHTEQPCSNNSPSLGTEIAHRLTDRQTHKQGLTDQTQAELRQQVFPLTTIAVAAVKSLMVTLLQAIPNAGISCLAAKVVSPGTQHWHWPTRSGDRGLGGGRREGSGDSTGEEDRSDPIWH